MDEQAVIGATRRWVADVVIGLNLCPFAGRVFDSGRVRFVVSAAADEEALLQDLRAEAQGLVAAPSGQTETTLLIHPLVLGNFLDYNDFLDAAERWLQRLGLGRVLQLASFHPEYQFAGAEPDALENYTNRSPYPMLHLLREQSVTAAAEAFGEEELLAVPERNVETLQRLGRERVLGLLRAAREGPAAGGG